MPPPNQFLEPLSRGSTLGLHFVDCTYLWVLTREQGRVEDTFPTVFLSPGLQAARVSCAVLPAGLQRLHLHLWSDWDWENLQHGGGLEFTLGGGRWGASGVCMRVQCGTAHCPQGPPEDPGIAPRALQLLFREMGTGGHHHVTLSMVEIYNEAVRSGMRGRLSPCPRVLQPPVDP